MKTNAEIAREAASKIGFEDSIMNDVLCGFILSAIDEATKQWRELADRLRDELSPCPFGGPNCTCSQCTVVAAYNQARGTEAKP